MATIINRAKAAAIIDETNGGFFTAWFVKKSGEVRKITCRTGVKKGVKGTPSTVARPDTCYKTVYDVVAGGFRVINLETLLEIKANKKTYLFRGYEKFVSIINNELILVKGA